MEKAFSRLRQEAQTGGISRSGEPPRDVGLCAFLVSPIHVTNDRHQNFIRSLLTPADCGHDTRVDEAYLEPTVDDDPSQFQWGVPDLNGLRALPCMNCVMLDCVPSWSRRFMSRMTGTRTSSVRSCLLPSLIPELMRHTWNPQSTTTPPNSNGVFLI
jgi:hypothetical protein